MTFTKTAAQPRRPDASIFALAGGVFFTVAAAFSAPAAAHGSGGQDHSALALAGQSYDSADTKAGETVKKGHGDSGGHHGGMKMGGQTGHDHGAAQFSFGHPSPDAKPDRQITIGALDTMQFDPASITVEAGSVVEFVVTNSGQVAHAWSIDTVEGQREHEKGMQSVTMADMMGHMDSEPNGFVLEPGETKTLVWMFTQGGDVQYACHLPGHFPAGMHGIVSVEGAGVTSISPDEMKRHSHNGSTSKEHKHH